MAGLIGLEKFDHIGIAVRSIEAALPLYRDILGGVFVNGADDDVIGIRTVQLRLLPGVRIELLQPVTDDCYLRDVLDRRGEGLHHVTVIVDDLEAAIKALEQTSHEVVDTDLSDPTWRESYVRPRSANGVLIQVVETDHDWDTPAVGIGLEDVLAGRYVWNGSKSVRREPSH